MHELIEMGIAVHNKRKYDEIRNGRIKTPDPSTIPTGPVAPYGNNNDRKKREDYPPFEGPGWQTIKKNAVTQFEKIPQFIDSRFMFTLLSSFVDRTRGLMEKNKENSEIRKQKYEKKRMLWQQVNQAVDAEYDNDEEE